jgi:hypothetical protein
MGIKSYPEGRWMTRTLFQNLPLTFCLLKAGSAIENLLLARKKSKQRKRSD